MKIKWIGKKETNPMWFCHEPRGRWFNGCAVLPGWRVKRYLFFEVWTWVR